MADKLTSGDQFPRLSLQIAGAGRLVIPDDLGSPLTLVLFYRGHW